MQPVVELKDVTHVYVSKKEAALAVEDISLQLNASEFVSLVGPSGCGKTTLLSIIAGLLSPARGSASINGRPIAGPSPEVGYMLQQDYLFPWKTIRDNARFGLSLMHKLTDESKSYTEHLLAEMGLAESAGRYPHQLSGGMRQRAALVRTLAPQPELMLLDEPFSALDYQTKLQLEELVAQTIRKHRKTALLVTHDLSEAIAMSDRVIVLDRNPGRVRRTFEIPEDIRSASPLEARELPGFHALFREVWDELLQSSESEGGTEG